MNFGERLMQMMVRGSEQTNELMIKNRKRRKRNQNLLNSGDEDDDRRMDDDEPAAEAIHDLTETKILTTTQFNSYLAI